MAAVPPSLRAIQAKRKQAAAQRGVPRATATSAVAALVKAVEAVQSAAAGGAAEAARGAGDAVAWVFSKVHFQSPDLAVGLLGMVACCLGTAVQAERDRMEARRLEALRNAEPEPDDDDGDAEEPEDLPELVEGDMEKELWSRIGILHGGGLNGDGQEDLDEEEIKEIDSARARRRKAAYERIIASGGANSLVLSNYAQLLYELDKDINRCFLLLVASNARMQCNQPFDHISLNAVRILIDFSRVNDRCTHFAGRRCTSSRRWPRSRRTARQCGGTACSSGTPAATSVARRKCSPAPSTRSPRAATTGAATRGSSG